MKYKLHPTAPKDIFGRGGMKRNVPQKNSPVSEPEGMSDWRLFSMIALQGEEDRRRRQATVVTEKEKCVISAVQEQNSK